MKRNGKTTADAQARPLGTEGSRRRWALLVWAALYAAWFLLMLALAVSYQLRS